MPLAGKRIGEMRKNPQYPEMGIFQGLQKESLRHGAAAPFVKSWVGMPRRRGPKLQATQSPFAGEMGAASPQKWDGSASPFSRRSGEGGSLRHERAATRKREERSMVVSTVQAQGVDGHW